MHKQRPTTGSFGRRLAPALFALSLVAPTITAAENPGAHRHGHALLQVAMEGNHMDLVLISPAANLAGFEHEPRTPDEEAILAKVEQWLGETPLVKTENGDCQVASGVVHLHQPSAGDHEHEHSHDHGHDHHHDDEQGETHREYEVSQQIECVAGATSGEFRSPLFDEFDGMEEVRVEWVTPTGQGSARLTRDNPDFQISE